MTKTLQAGMALLALGGLLAGQAGASYTCSTVAARGQFDPDGTNYLFTNRFGDDAAVNAAGDVVFSASPKAVLTKRNQAVYHYPAVGSAEVVVRQGDAAPGGGVFSNVSRTCFSAPCLNDGGDIGFVGQVLGLGDGVFVRPSGGGLVAAMRTGDPSPGGGFFDETLQFAGCTSSTDMAFVSDVFDGPDGLFRWDGTTQTVGTVHLVGDSTGAGRQFCEFGDLSVSDAGIAFRALTQTDCALAEVPVEGVFVSSNGVVTTVALEGDPVPTGGGNTILRFLKGDVPQVNAAGNVTFGAQTIGTLSLHGVFFYDAGTMMTSTVAQQFDAAPDTSGFLRRFDSHRLADTDAVYAKAKVQKSPAKQGVFVYDGTPEAALLKSDPAPTDAFGPGSSFRGLKGRGMGIAADGSQLAITALVRDTVPPGKKRAVVRCEP
jgi:hypothetical protein